MKSNCLGQNNPFYKKKVLVLGLGKTGIAACRLLRSVGASVKATDKKKTILETTNFSRKELSQIEFQLGSHTPSFINDCDYAILSPGIPFTAPVLSWLKKRAIPLLSEIELASYYCSQPIIAITGSNGKTTTTAWLEHTLNHAGFKAIAAGNIGYAFSQALLENPTADYFILELSSFQLKTIQQFRPYIAILLNLSPDHLDVHTDLDDYFSSKLNIFKNQKKSDWAFVNITEYTQLSALMNLKAPIKTFGYENTSCANIFVKNDTIILAQNDKEIGLLSCNKIGLPGQHNIENVMPVILTGLQLQIPLPVIIESIQTFKGKPHRLEICGKKGSITYINDSKATTVDSVKKALLAFEKDIILIMGGRDKQADFRDLRPLIKKSVRHLIVFGESQEKITTQLANIIPIVQTKSLFEAIQSASHHAIKNSIILFSPGCTSFDLYNNYEERGNDFKKIVAALIRTA
ncbi:UDP-N-acetylmuramoyl-L-alanine--D-glutamate ligase [Chlamydiota bacterium]